MVRKINERSMGSYYDKYGWKKDLETEDALRRWIEDAISEMKADCRQLFYRQDKQLMYKSNVEEKFWEDLVEDIMQKIKDHYASEDIYVADI